jgi:Uma2 family endonuclease
MLNVTRRPLTMYDYRQVPPGGPRYQLIEGEMHMTPAPNRFHQHIVGRIHLMIAHYLETHPIGWVYVSPFDVVLTDVNVYQPDVLFVADKHRAVLTDAGAEGAPDLVVEILSPATARHDTGVKREVYARTGVAELWIIDPDTRRFLVYRLQEDRETPIATYDDQAIFATPLLPGLNVDTAWVFQMRR